MDFSRLQQQFQRISLEIQTKHWPLLVAKMEAMRKRHLFLRALILGLILSLPVQCTRVIYNSYFAGETEKKSDDADALTIPDANQGNITRMPNPRPRSYIDPVELEQTQAQGETNTENEEPSNLAENSPGNIHSSNQDIQILHRTTPKYPLAALRNNETGIVILRVFVNVQGKPSLITIEQSSHSRDLDRAARDAVQEWRFSPKIEAGNPVESYLLIPIEFNTQ